jgi:hypothetical protein
MLAFFLLSDAEAIEEITLAQEIKKMRHTNYSFQMRHAARAWPMSISMPLQMVAPACSPS